MRHAGGTSFCEPIGHLQVDGDYRESWQPQPMTPRALEEAHRIAKAVTGALGGAGIFGVELFVKGDEVWFSEVSPRPHDTGMVTLVSQDLSEFALHVRAILGLPVPGIRQFGPAASCALLVDGESSAVTYEGWMRRWRSRTPRCASSASRRSAGHRRMGVALALGATVDDARAKARRVTAAIRPVL